MATTYKQLLLEGEKYQNFVALQFVERWHIPIDYYTSKHDQYNIGESKQGIEVKLDNRCSDTGRLSIEIAERTDQSKHWTPSGIHRRDNTWLYIQGSYDIIFAFSKKVLQRYFLLNKPEINERKTIKTWYLPFRTARTLSEFVIEPTTIS